VSSFSFTNYASPTTEREIASSQRRDGKFPPPGALALIGQNFTLLLRRERRPFHLLLCREDCSSALLLSAQQVGCDTFTRMRRARAPSSSTSTAEIKGHVDPGRVTRTWPRTDRKVVGDYLFSSGLQETSQQSLPCAKIISHSTK